MKQKLIKLRSPVLGFAAALSFPSLQADGPGIPNLTWSSADVGVTLSGFDTTLSAPRGHGFVTMHRGYLVLINTQDAGGGEGTSSITTFDISDPYNPVPVFTTVDNPNYGPGKTHNPINLREVHSIAFSGDFMALTSSGGDETGIQIWDMSKLDKPSSASANSWFGPKRASVISLPGAYGGDYFGAPWSMSWNGQYIYAAVPSVGLYIIDASDVNNPTLPPLTGNKPNPAPISAIGGTRNGLHLIQTMGNIMMQARNNFTSLDIYDPLNPILKGDDAAKVGYSGTMYGYQAFTVGNDFFRAYNLDENGGSTFNRQVTVDGMAGGYATFQDDYLFYGGGSGWAKVKVINNPNFGGAQTFTVERPVARAKDWDLFKKVDWDFAVPLGNLVFIGNDHGGGSALQVHQAAKDLKGPEVMAINPKNNQTNVPVTARIGIHFSDQVDVRTLNTANITVREVGTSNALTGRYAHGLGIVNFDPYANLKNNTTYEVIVKANGVKDLVGNTYGTRFRSLFSTGSQVVDDNPVVTPLIVSLGEEAPAATGTVVTFDASITGGEGSTSVSWDFGDGTTRTTSTGTVAKTYSEPGIYNVIVTATRGTQTQTSSLVATIHLPLTAQKPTHSTTILYDGANSRVWNVNTDSNTISAINTSNNNKALERAAGEHPRTLALAPDGTIWVANEASDTVTVHNSSGNIVDTIQFPRGSAPFGVVFTPDGSKAFVSLANSWQIARLNPSTRAIEQTAEVNQYPRGLAVSADSSRLFVTRFISAADEGEITEVNPNNLSVVRRIPLAFDQGPDTEDTGRGVPNYLISPIISPDGQTLAIPGTKANTARGVLRDGIHLDFDNTVRTITMFVDLTDNAEDLPRRSDLNNRDSAIAAAYSPLGNYIFVATQGSNTIDVLNAYTGEILFTAMETGLAPRGLVISEDGKTLYIQNFMSRDVKIIDISQITEDNINSPVDLKIVDVVATELLSAEVLKGKQIFYNASDPRMSQDRYISCATCHTDGGQDGRIWDFTGRGEGLRNTIELNGRAGTAHGLVHWSANFDEIQDFENDIRNEQAGNGFLSNADFAATEDTLGLPKVGRNADLDALAAYVSSLDTVGKSPFRQDNGSLSNLAIQGQNLFATMNCATCHDPKQGFTDGKSHDIGTIKASSGKRLGANLSGIDTPTLLGL